MTRLRARAVTVLRGARPPGRPGVVVVAAGTADVPVAEEARVTAWAMGEAPVALYDVGVFFTRQDMEKLIQTNLEFMYRGDAPPTFRDVDGRTRDPSAYKYHKGGPPLDGPGALQPEGARVVETPTRRPEEGLDVARRRDGLPPGDESARLVGTPLHKRVRRTP